MFELPSNGQTLADGESLTTRGKVLIRIKPFKHDAERQFLVITGRMEAVIEEVASRMRACSPYYQFMFTVHKVEVDNDTGHMRATCMRNLNAGD
jgi:CO/xanthine dehydrogenase Mo-binding subunit